MTMLHTSQNTHTHTPPPTSLLYSSVTVSVYHIVLTHVWEVWVCAVSKQRGDDVGSILSGCNHEGRLAAAHLCNHASTCHSVTKQTRYDTTRQDTSSDMRRVISV